MWFSLVCSEEGGSRKYVKALVMCTLKIFLGVKAIFEGEGFGFKAEKNNS